MFTDAAWESNLRTMRKTRHGTWLDFDNDGDPDFYEPNMAGDNVLWQNLFRETGQVRFVDVTGAMSAPGTYLGRPTETFAAAASDLNNDGWIDLVAFNRPTGDCIPDAEPGLAEYGHVIFLNLPGVGFLDVTPLTDLNSTFIDQRGVMGSQLGDINADGIDDVWIANGGPAGGQTDQLYVSVGLRNETVAGVGNVTVPLYEDWTALLDFPSAPVRALPYPPYPYRGHGSCLTDFDGDGLLEIAVANGGPASMPDAVREPNRLFKFEFATAPNWLKVRVEGNGTTVNRDAFGTRVTAEVSNGGGPTREVHRAHFSASGFSAQNGPELFLGLGNADTVHSVRIAWPDGTVEHDTSVTGPNQTLVYSR